MRTAILLAAVALAIGGIFYFAAGGGGMPKAPAKSDSKASLKTDNAALETAQPSKASGAPKAAAPAAPKGGGYVFKHGKGVERLQFAAASPRLLSAGGGHVKVWELPKSPGAEPKLAGEFSGKSGALSPDGKRLLLVDLLGRKAELLDVASKTAVPGFDCSGATLGAYSPGGQALVLAVPKQLRVLAAATGKPLHACALPLPAVSAILPSHDGKSAALHAINPGMGIGDATEAFAVVTLADGQVLCQAAPNFKDGGPGIAALAYSGDGRFLAVGGQQPIFQLWSVAKKGVAFELKGAKVRVTALAFTPDGKFVLAGSLRQIQAWDTASGGCRFTLEPHIGWVTALAFSSDGTRVASGGQDESIQVWQVVPSSTQEFSVR
ncbi:MAG: hypothetical protein L6R28_04555 [Planctomycetes bacterium]|nr:hypothetical protein [Planctomycetota bacterium]